MERRRDDSSRNFDGDGRDPRVFPATYPRLDAVAKLSSSTTDFAPLDAILDMNSCDDKAWMELGEAAGDPPLLSSSSERNAESRPSTLVGEESAVKKEESLLPDDGLMTDAGKSEEGSTGSTGSTGSIGSTGLIRSIGSTG